MTTRHRAMTNARFMVSMWSMWLLSNSSMTMLIKIVCTYMPKVILLMTVP